MQTRSSSPVRFLRTVVGVVAISTATIAACGDVDQIVAVVTGEQTDFLGGGGFNGAGNVGGQGGNDWPSGWIPPQGSGTRFDTECTVDGFCAVGGNTQQFGDLTEPDSVDRVFAGDSLCFDCFAWFSTQDIDDTFNEIEVDVLISGMESVPLSGLGFESSWDLRFTYAFLEATGTTGETSGSVSLLIVPEFGTPVELFFANRSQTLDDDGSRATASRAGGCGTTDRVASRLGNIVDDTFVFCTGWQEARVELDAFRGQTFRIRMLVREGDGGAPAAMTVDNMSVWEIAGGR